MPPRMTLRAAQLRCGRWCRRYWSAAQIEPVCVSLSANRRDRIVPEADDHHRFWRSFGSDDVSPAADGSGEHGLGYHPGPDQNEAGPAG